MAQIRSAAQSYAENCQTFAENRQIDAAFLIYTEISS